MKSWISRSRGVLVLLVLLLAFSPMSVLADAEDSNKLTYVALGDSLAAGINSNDKPSAGYAGLIEGDLENRGYAVTLHNKGIPGATSADVLEGLGGISELATADIITVSAGANDILNAVKPLLESGIDPSDLSEENIAQLQQAVIATATAAIDAAETADEATEAAEGKVNEAKNAIADLKTAVLELKGIVVPIQAFLPEDVNSLFTTIETMEVTDDNLNTVMGILDLLMGGIDKLGESVDLIPLPDVKDQIKEKLPNIEAKTISSKTIVSEANIVVDQAIKAVEASDAAAEAATSAQKALNKVLELADEFNQKVIAVGAAIQGVGANTAGILQGIRSVNPTADIYVMGYYNALPYLPKEVQEMTKPMLDNLNAAISAPTAQFSATFVPVAHLFEGNFETYLPNINNIHPSSEGYGAIATQFMGFIGPNHPAFILPLLNVKLGDEIDVQASQILSIENSFLRLPNDLPEGTKLTVTADNVGDIEGLKQAGDVLNFEFTYPPESEDYEGKFTLYMGSDENVDVNSVDIYHYNQDDDTWIAQNGDVNLDTGEISLKVDHFSSYGVFAKVEKQDENNGDDETDEQCEGDDCDEEEKEVVVEIGDGDNGTTDGEKVVKSGTTLPDTATNHYNLMVIGLVIILAGSGIWLYRRRKGY